MTDSDACILQKAVDNCHYDPFGDVFSLPEYLIPLFLGLINRRHPALNRIFSTRTRLSNVTSLNLSM